MNWRASVLAGLCFAGAASALAQSRLPLLADIEAAQAARQRANQAVIAPRWSGRWSGPAEITWREGSAWVKMNLETGEKGEGSAPEAGARRQGPGRGRQAAEVSSPDGALTAIHNAGSVYLKQDGSERLIAEGDPSRRIKFGTGSWVYGEELGQDEAMGFSPDGSKLWMYRFDESKVVDYPLVLDQAKPQGRLYNEAYPKPGQPNPEVGLFVHHVKQGRMVEVKVRPGAFDEGSGHYIYSIRWVRGGSRLLFHRTDRLQKTLEICSANPETGEVEVLDSETFAPAWVENSMPMTMLDDLPGIENAPQLQGMAIMLSERSGWINAYLLDLVRGGAIPITKNAFDIRSILGIDLKRRELWYTAADGDLPAFSQVHRIKLDGTGGKRITAPSLRHSAWLSPGFDRLVVQSESALDPPVISILSRDGAKERELMKGSDEGLEAAGWPRKKRRITFVSADGTTQLSAMVSMPPGLPAGAKAPLLVSVYNGPLGPMAEGFSERFSGPEGFAEYGFAIAEIESRGQSGRGRAFKTALYRQMGRAEIDDIAAGVREIIKMPDIDASRVGIHGTSYGGYASLMAILRHPDLFHAASSSSCVSDWRNYDTIYTERYMGVLPESEADYAAGSTLTYADRLKGWLMIFYGTADDNTHPANSLQIIRELQAKRKSFEVQVGVDAGHSGVNSQRMLEFFIERLGMARAAASSAR